MKIVKSVKLSKAEIAKLNKERSQRDPKPSLHAWMIYKLKLPI